MSDLAEELRSRLAAARARLEAGPSKRPWRGILRALHNLTGPAYEIASALKGVSRPLQQRSAATMRPLTRLARGLTSGWYRELRYHDGRITLDAHGVTLHRYYLPFGRKRIAYGDIRGVWQWPLSGARSYRVHGPGWGRVWYPHDPKRSQRGVGVLVDTGGWLRPVITPDEPKKVLALIRAELTNRESAGRDDEGRTGVHGGF